LGGTGLPNKRADIDEKMRSVGCFRATAERRDVKLHPRMAFGIGVGAGRAIQYRNLEIVWLRISRIKGYEFQHNSLDA
jgi:hypothetical protein